MRPFAGYANSASPELPPALLPPLLDGGDSMVCQSLPYSSYYLAVASTSTNNTCSWKCLTP